MSKTKESEGKPQNESEISPDATVAGSSPTPTPPELASLMQVREILTGPLASDVEKRIEHMDKRLEERLEEFGFSSAERLDALERDHRDQLGRLREEVGDERGQFHDRLERLERELRLGLEQLRGEIRDATDQQATTTEALRTEFAKELDAIRGTIEEMIQKVTLKLDEQRIRMRNELVDRDSLCAALSEVAMRLAPPTAEEQEIDPAQHDMELDQILDGVTSGQL